MTATIRKIEARDEARWRELWDGYCRFYEREPAPKVNDYRSWGCIKMAPDDLKQLTRRYHRFFKAEVRYPTKRVRVRVKS